MLGQLEQWIEHHGQTALELRDKFHFAFDPSGYTLQP